MSCFTLSGNSAPGFDGTYCDTGIDINGYGLFQNENGAYFYYYPGYWQFDFQEQDGSLDLYEGGCISVTDPLENAEQYMSGEAFEVYNSCNGSYMTMQMVASGAELSIAGHYDDFYNGDYWETDPWNGVSHFENADGAHLYWLGGPEGAGYWQLDDTRQDGSNDWYAGGYFYCAEGFDGCDYYDANGVGVYPFTSGDLTVTLGASHYCQDGLQITGHPDDWYNGCFTSAEDWNGFPHFTNENGAHLYWLDYDGYGYWQLDYNYQDGTQDLYDGGFMYCEGEWFDCPDNYDATGYAEYDFSVGTLGFRHELASEYYYDCSGFWLTHPTDDFYSGYYWQAEDWGDAPHFQNENGAHAYWLDYDGYGYWQFDYNVQDGTQDLFDGGYLYCEGEWWDCGVDFDEWGYGEADFSLGTYSFQKNEGCYAALAAAQETTTTNVLAACLLTAAFLAGLRQVTKKTAETSQIEEPLAA